MMYGFQYVLNLVDVIVHTIPYGLFRCEDAEALAFHDKSFNFKIIVKILESKLYDYVRD